MRCTQFIGLSYEAETFIDENVKHMPSETCVTCGHTSGGEFTMRVYDTEIGRSAGMFDDGPDLHEYILKDGQRIREVVQCTPWSSGPMIFLCLENEAGKKICEWDDEEIESHG